MQTFLDMCERLQRPPTISEMSSELGLSANGVQQPLGKLIDEGLIIAKTKTIRKPQRVSAAGLRWLERAKKESSRT